MKKLFTMFLLLMVSGALIAGEDAKWETDFKKAQERAAAENKDMLVNFTGSDWCGWCKRLDREVFQTQTFKDFASKELVLVKVDFPRYKKQDPSQRQANDQLAKKYGVRGFPTIYLMDSNAKILLKTGYQSGGSEGYIDHLSPHLN